MKISTTNLKLLNKGANSEVYLYGNSQKGVVIKLVKTSCKAQCRHLRNQFSILKKIDHENVIKPLKYNERISIDGTHQDKQNQTLNNVLVLQNALHGNLLDLYKKRITKLIEARWLFAEICEGVQHLHQKNICHRDLKLENILIGEIDGRITVKLADFGFACQISQNCTSKTYKGTKRGYMAPQIHQILQNPQKQYNIKKTDIFALGVIMFSLVLKRLPFQHATPENVHYKLIKEQKYEEFWKIHLVPMKIIEYQEDNMIEDFKQLFISMVKFNPEQRPSIKEIFLSSWMRGRQSIIRSLTKEIEK